MHPPMTMPPVTDKHNPKYPKRSFFPYCLTDNGNGGLSASADGARVCLFKDVLWFILTISETGF